MATFLFAVGGLLVIAGLVTGVAAYGLMHPGKPHPDMKREVAAAQPILEMSAPDARHELVWDPTKRGEILIAKEGEVEPTRWSVPHMRLKTSNDISAQDATIEWRADVVGLENLIKSSERLRKYTFTFAENEITIDGSGGPGHVYEIRQHISLPIPFITPAGTAVHIPLPIFAKAMLYTIALLPDELGAEVGPFPFSAVISWNLPSPGRQVFKINAVMTNVKPQGLAEPAVDAVMSFSIDKVD